MVVAWNALIPRQLARLPLVKALRRRYSGGGGPLTEEDAGISEYLVPGVEGFPGQLKQAYDDFHVHEIDPDGKEMHLTELWLNKDALADNGVAPLPRSSGRKYLHFRLYKERLDTLEALSRIGHCLGCSRRSFRFAGHKDRCAVTVQRVSCYGLSPNELQKATLHPHWDERIRVSNLEVREDEIDLGDLQGNRFHIVLREVPVGKDIAPCFESLRDNGFLNYFGLQRFGSQRIHTFCVGAALIADRLEDAVRLILGDDRRLLSVFPMGSRLVAERTSETSKDREILEAQRIYTERGDAILALQQIPKGHVDERIILAGLADGLSFDAALRRLPRQLLMLYVKAAQSLIFNHVLSRRIRYYGLNPVIGDFLLDLHVEEPNRVSDAFRRRERTELSRVREFEVGRDHSAELADVVLPLPGARVVYPPHMREAYEEVSRDLLGVSLDDFHRELPLELSLAGAYRHVVVRPEAVSWRLLSAMEASHLAKARHGRLLPTDVDRLRAGHSVHGSTPHIDRPQKGPESLFLPSTEGCAVLSCTLPPSAYLTVATRELTRGRLNERTVK